MATIISSKWMINIETRIADKLPIDETISFNKAAQWLVTILTRNSIPYKIYNLGAGVKRIVTTDIDICPCCKHKL